MLVDDGTGTWQTSGSGQFFDFLQRSHQRKGPYHKGPADSQIWSKNVKAAAQIFSVTQAYIEPLFFDRRHLIFDREHFSYNRPCERKALYFEM